MAGVGIQLKKIYSKQTLTTNLIGFGYSLILTIAPMLFVIAAMTGMQAILEVSKTGYAMRELYAGTVLYIFIFSLLGASPFNSVISRYIADVIYNEKYADIRPCYYTGMVLHILVCSLFVIPFCIHEHLVGKVDIWYVFAGYCGFMALLCVFYGMLFLSICKVYGKITLFFLVGMSVTLLSSFILHRVFHWEVTFSMLVALDIGFIIIALFEHSIICHYFEENSGNYTGVLSYFVKYWKLMVANFMYTLGLYVHNFVFWIWGKPTVVAKSFVSMGSYDMATFVALLINISSSIIFISRIEMHFSKHYKAYSEAVIGGRGVEIWSRKSRMFRQLSEELLNLVRIQFIISVILYFITVIILPQVGMGGMVMRIYPCLAVGYFVLFLMYAEIIFEYYFNDTTGAMLNAIVFMVVTVLGSCISVHLSEIWYGLGFVIGAVTGFCFGYFRLRWLEKNLDFHIFCDGTLLESGKGEKPSNLIFDRYHDVYPQKEEEEGN